MRLLARMADVVRVRLEIVLLLALDTATPAVTVALHDEDRVVAESTTIDARRHTELLIPAVVETLATARADRREISEIAVGVGPGPFTGLRVGLAAALTLGTALDVPIRGVCSHDIIAYGVTTADAHDHRPFVVATDARRREVYWAAYDAAGRRTAGPFVGPASGIAAALAAQPGPADTGAGGWDPAGPRAAGAGPRVYPESFAAALDPEYPSASDLASAVVRGAVEILEPHPLYLRRPDVTPAANRKSVLTPPARQKQA